MNAVFLFQLLQYNVKIVCVINELDKIVKGFNKERDYIKYQCKFQNIAKNFLYFL